MIRQLSIGFLLLSAASLLQANTLITVSTSGIDCGTGLCALTTLTTSSGMSTTALAVYVGPNANVAPTSYSAEVIPLAIPNSDGIGTSTPISSLPGNAPFDYSPALGRIFAYSLYLARTWSIYGTPDSVVDLQQALWCYTAACNPSTLTASQQADYTELGAGSQEEGDIENFGDIVQLDQNGNPIYTQVPLLLTDLVNGNIDGAYPSDPDPDPSPSTAPEPSSLALIGLMITGGVGARLFRRK